MTSASWLSPSWLNRAPGNRQLRTDKPPQKQCRERGDHIAHCHAGAKLAIYYCQGRGHQ